MALLRAALLDRDGVDAALRTCFFGNPMYASALFTASVRENFAGKDLREVSKFLSRLRFAARPPGAPPFPPREAEAIMRGALGETDMLAYVPPDKFSYMDIGIAVLSRLFAEWQPGPSAVGALLEKTTEMTNVAMTIDPNLAYSESRRFAAGLASLQLPNLLDA